MLREAAAQLTPASELLDILGWDEAMLTRVCKKHQIDLPTYAAQGATARAPQPDEPESFAGLSLEQIIAVLPQRQSEVLALWARQPRDVFLTSTEAAEILVREPDKIAISLRAVDRKLQKRRASFRLEVRRGRTGGYRLRDVRENAL
jgi:hypothetical protein